MERRVTYPSRLKAAVYLCLIVLCLLASVGCGSDGELEPNLSRGGSEEVVSQVEFSELDAGVLGGSFEVGAFRFDVPEGAFSTTVDISTSIRFTTLPPQVRPAFLPRNISVSNPDSYTPNSATISLELKNKSARGRINTIYFSQDGTSWRRLEGVIEGERLKASIPSFGTFVAGEHVFSVEFVNRSFLNTSAVVFQPNPELPSGEFSVAWKVLENLAPGASETISWGPDYGFFFKETSSLQAGQVLKEWRQGFVNFAEGNTLRLEKNRRYNSLEWRDPGSFSRPFDALFFDIARSVASGEAAIGITLGSSPLRARMALPNSFVSFAREPSPLALASGSFSKGEVLPRSLPVQARFEFPPDVFKLKATLESDGQWTVQPE